MCPCDWMKARKWIGSNRNRSPGLDASGLFGERGRERALRAVDDPSRARRRPRGAGKCDGLGWTRRASPPRSTPRWQNRPAP